MEIRNVIIIQIRITVMSISVEVIELKKVDEIIPAKNIVIIEINIGNLPLQGTKLFVRIANNLSLGESIIRQPTTPQALHPNPIHIVSDCFPWQDAFLKRWSMLKAILGKNPESSNNVKRGKKIAIGGSITETTEASV